MSMTRSERAMQVWQILIAGAYNRSSFTYGQVATMLGMGGAGVMAQFLDPIMRYCSANNLPPLTVLVVNKETGTPGEGLSTLEELNRDREAVFNYNWYGMYPVQITDFEH